MRWRVFLALACFGIVLLIGFSEAKQDIRRCRLALEIAATGRDSIMVLTDKSCRGKLP